MKLKYIYSTIVMLFICAVSFAQSTAINYQAIARNSSGDPIVNQSVNVQFAIKFGSPSSSASYVETHAVTTDPAGVFNLAIGTGSVVSGSYEALDWGSDQTYVTVSVNGSEMGSPEILAVPYALASGKSYDTKLSDLTDVSGSANTGNYLQYNGSTWTPGDVAESPWTEASGELYYEGNVGIANTNPDEELVIGTNLGMNWSVPAMTVGSNSTATGGAISLGYNTTSPRRLHISSIGGVNTIATENAIGLGKEPLRLQTEQLTVGDNPEIFTRNYSIAATQGQGFYGVAMIESQKRYRWEFYLANLSSAPGHLRLYFTDVENSTSGVNHRSWKGTFDENGAYSQASDRRFKEDIAEMDDVLENIMKLKTYNYKYKSSTDRRYNGIMAQEAKDLFPDVVSEGQIEEGSPETMMQVNYSQLSVIALKGIQEQQQIIRDQEKKIKSLEERLLKLEARLN